MGHRQGSMVRYSGMHGTGVVGGYVDIYQGEDPAAGEEASITVPEKELWEILLWTVQFSTDSTNIQRKVRVEIKTPSDADPAGFRLFVATFAVKDADTTTDFFLAQWGHDPADITISGDDDAARAALPRKMMLPGGSEITTITENIQAGDNFTAPTMLAERFAV